MKKVLFLLFAAICMIFFSACVGKNKYSNIENQEERKIEGFKTEEDYPNVFLDNSKLKTFVNFIDYDNTECPYAEIFNIDEAICEKSGRNFQVVEHKYDFFQGEEKVYTKKLIENVTRNNKEFLKTGGRAIWGRTFLAHNIDK